MGSGSSTRQKRDNANDGRSGSQSEEAITKAATTASRAVPFAPHDPVELLNAKGAVVAFGSVFDTDKLHGHLLSTLERKSGNKHAHYIVVRISQLVKSHTKDAYPYKMLGPEVPSVIGDMYRMNNYVWDVKRLRKRPAPPTVPQVTLGSVKLLEESSDEEHEATTSARPSTGSAAGGAKHVDKLELPKSTKPVASTARQPSPSIPLSIRISAPHGTPSSGAVTKVQPQPQTRTSTRSSQSPKEKRIRTTGVAKSKHPQQPAEEAVLVPPQSILTPAEIFGNPGPAASRKTKASVSPQQHTTSEKPDANTVPSEAGGGGETKGSAEEPTISVSKSIGLPPQGSSEPEPQEKPGVVAGDDVNYTDEEVDNMPSTVPDEDDLIIGEEYQGESEEVGDEVKVPYAGSRDLYKTEQIRIRIDQLVFPPNVARDSDRKHVGLLKASLRDGIMYSLGHIAVCRKPSAKNLTPVRHSDEKFEGVEMDEKPVLRDINGKAVLSLLAYYVINGMHRTCAIDRLFIEAQTLEQRQEYGVIYVLLFSRKDGQEMTFYELLAIGGSENDIGAVDRKPPTFADQIRLAMSCAKEILLLNAGSNIIYVGIGNTFTAHNIIQAKHKETHRKYAQCALTFLANPALYRRFQEYWEDGELFRISHFQSSIYHNKFSPYEQVVVLDVLHYFLKEKKRSRSARHFSSTAAKHFYMECRDLLDAVEYFAKVKNTTVSELLKSEVAVTKDEGVTVERVLVTTMTGFSTTLSTAQMASKAKIRFKRFRTTLSDTFTPETLEAKKKKAAEEKRRKDEQRKTQQVRQKIARAAKKKAIAVTAEITAAERTRAGGSELTGKRKRLGMGGPPKLRAKFASDPDVEYTWTTKTINPFDDEIPAQYPKGYSRRPAKWKGPTAWVQLLTVPPHRLWSDELRVRHPEPWLYGMGMTKKHRSHIFLSCQDLERNHHAVYFHAALQAAKQPDVIGNQLYDAPGVQEDENMRTSRIARAHPDLSQRYLVHCKESVMSKGYCVIEGIFDDSNIQNGPFNTVYDEEPARKVVDFYARKCPSEEELKQGNSRNEYWSAIFNNSTTAQEDVAKTAQGRFTTNKAGLFEHIEQDRDTVHIARYRAALDVRALQICVAMGLEEAGTAMMAIPCTGSRRLTSTHNCERQIAHSDFDTLANARDTFSPRPTVDYSIIWTADDPFPLIVWENSHILQCGTPAISKKIADCVPAKRVLVPAFSCIIFRGDLMHCGPGWQDHTLEERRAQRYPLLVRFHMYVIRWGIKFEEREERVTDVPVVPDTVYFIDKFQPTVQVDPSWVRQSNEDQNQ